MSIKVLQLHKRDSYKIKHIQDKYSINIETNCFAIADGTTQSFKSEKWADLLVRSFTDNPKFDIDELILCFKNKAKEFQEADIIFSGNPAIASIEKALQKKGATSTFIGIQIDNNQNLKFIGCGDSNLFIYKNDDFTSLPFFDILELDANKSFINTEEINLDHIDSGYFQERHYNLQGGEVIIMATDAISRLIFKSPELIPHFLKIDSFDDLHRFCMENWESKKLEEDDITAVIIKSDNDASILEILPNEAFEFPKAEEFIFNPIVFEPSNPQFSDMQMQEINNQFNGVARDMHTVKYKLRSQSILLFTCISMLAVTIMFLIFIIRFNKSPVIVEDTKTSSSKEINKLKSQLRAAEAQISELENKIENQNSKTSTTGDNIDSTDEKRN